VVVREHASLTEDDILTHCRAHLAGFKTPKRVFLVDSLPKNPSGKLLKRVPRDRFSRELVERAPAADHETQ
jgi:fatty-acyl-CoA synthase